MKACVLKAASKMDIADLPVPAINNEEVLVRVTLCGVCASELEAWVGGNGVDHVFGHEAVGIVEAMGQDVEGFQIGDRVTGLMYQAYAEYTKAHYTKLIKVPESLDDIEAMGEPLSCLVSGANRTPVHPEDTAAIIGTGFMGLGFLQLLRIKGVGQTIAIGKQRQDGLDQALHFGADAAIFPDEVEERHKVTEWGHIGRGVNITAEVSGTQGGLELASQMTAAHGTMSIVGFHQVDGGMRNVNMQLWNWKAITVVNAHERRSHVHMASMNEGFSLIEKGLFNMKGMITHEFGLQEVNRAYEAMLHKPKGFIKAVVRMN